MKIHSPREKLWPCPLTLARSNTFSFFFSIVWRIDFDIRQKSNTWIFRLNKKLQQSKISRGKAYKSGSVMFRFFFRVCS